MIRKKEEQREVVIDLTGPEGNVFVLIAYARKFARQLAEIWAEEMISNKEHNIVLRSLDLGEDELLPETLADKIVGEMMESDYENAVKVFDRYFGSFVILER
jgi:hypothetical protein